MTDVDFLLIIRRRLTDYRYNHSLAVAKSAAKLARLYNESETRAYTAGLLHDVMKDSEKQEQLDLFTKHSIVLSPLEKASPELWHPIAGECFAREELGIDDEDVLAAIRYHTTGRASMSLLEKIIFVADFISEDRQYDGVERMRRKAAQSLEFAMAEGYQFTMTKLLEDERLIHPHMLEGYNELVLRKDDYFHE